MTVQSGKPNFRSTCLKTDVPYIEGLVQERHNSSALTVELSLSFLALTHRYVLYKIWLAKPNFLLAQLKIYSHWHAGKLISLTAVIADQCLSFLNHCSINNAFICHSTPVRAKSILTFLNSNSHILFFFLKCHDWCYILGNCPQLSWLIWCNG